MKAYTKIRSHPLDKKTWGEYIHEEPIGKFYIGSATDCREYNLFALKKARTDSDLLLISGKVWGDR